MRITNKTDVTQTFNGLVIKPGETVDTDSGEVVKPDAKPAKRGRPRKDK